MDLESILTDNSSKKMVDLLKEIAINDSEVFAQLYLLAFSERKSIAWKAAWVLAHISESNPDLFLDKADELSKQLLITAFDGVRRSFLYILSQIPAISFSVDLINTCFEWMLSPKQPVAVQVYCMRVLLQVCRTFPEFKEELQASLENAEPSDYTKGFASCRKNTLIALSRIK